MKKSKRKEKSIITLKRMKIALNFKVKTPIIYKWEFIRFTSRGQRIRLWIN